MWVGPVKVGTKIPHGKGIYVDKGTESFYDGFFANGVKEGFGMLTKKNGDCYFGNFKSGEQ